MMNLDNLPQPTQEQLREAAGRLMQDEAATLRLMALCLLQSQVINEQAAQIEGLHDVIRRGPAIHISYPKGWPLAVPPPQGIAPGSLFTPN